MARTKKTREMTTEAAKEIAEKIDVLTAAIGRPEHPGCVCAAGAGVTIKQYFGSAPRTSRSSSSLPPEELQQLTQQIRDQLEESITEKVTRHLMASFSQMQSQIQSQMQSQGLAVPPEPLVGPSDPRVSTKGSCVDPLGNDPETGDSDRPPQPQQQNQPQQNNYDLSSNRYNPEWRNHPNLRWSSPQQQQ
ncbi:hypothetical protein HKD37_03G006789 [Glycine soja]